MEELTELRILHIHGNLINKITGLETLTNLFELTLSNNLIKDITGLEALKNLSRLYLADNPIRENERHLIRKDSVLQVVRESVQEVVKYCKEKADKAKK